MGVSLEFADGKGGRTPSQDVATNRGWVDFGTWVESLPKDEDYLLLEDLWDDGDCTMLEGLIDELKEALKATKPSKSARSVAENIIALCQKHRRKTKKLPAADALFIVDDF